MGRRLRFGLPYRLPDALPTVSLVISLMVSLVDLVFRNFCRQGFILWSGRVVRRCHEVVVVVFALWEASVVVGLNNRTPNSASEYDGRVSLL